KEKVDPEELDLKQYAKVQKFRERLEKRGLVATYEGVRGSKDAFFEKVEEHLRKILQLMTTAMSVPASGVAADPTVYLQDLLKITSYIDIRGLQIGQMRAFRFPIGDLFTSITATQAAENNVNKPTEDEFNRPGSQLEMVHTLWESATMPLHFALGNDRLLIIGGPGAGKTTFLRWVAHTLCQTELGTVYNAAESRLGVNDRTFPIFVRLAGLSEYISRHSNDSTAPASEVSPAWLPHFLTATSQEGDWGLNGKFFTEQLERGLCTILLDGLDEVPDGIARQRLSQLIESATNTESAYHGCRFVLTSRPASYREDVPFPNFVHALIDPFTDLAVETFLSRWCEALYSEDSATARNYYVELLEVLRARPEIRLMARNPLILTAVAVTHWNQRSLPEQRADLYESIILWLSRSREQRLRREKGERALVLLQKLAFAMQNHPDGVHTSVPIHWAAERLAGNFAEGDEAYSAAVERAMYFLANEQLDSGIICGNSGYVSFLHRTFQEYLTARDLSARPETELSEFLLRSSGLIDDPSWTEVTLLLGSILHRQSPSRVDKLIDVILTQLGETPPLGEMAKGINLLSLVGEMLAPLGYRIRDPRYHRLAQNVEQVEFVQQIARSAAQAKHLSKIGEIVSKLPEGDSSFVRETSRIREMTKEIVEIQNRLDSVTQPILGEPYARLLVKTVENFNYRVRGFSEPLASEFVRASDAWLQLARSQLSHVERIASAEAIPQVFRAGDPVDAEHEAFVIRFAVVGEIERQVMLSNGCPG
ncbi:MAG: NACHT domain-containing protein, partial [Methylobacter sp.]